MERLAKRCRVMGGWILLCDLAVVFIMSYTNRTQENYETLLWSQSDYLNSLLQGCLPHGTEQASVLTSSQIAYILFLMLLPMLCTLFAGIYGIVGSSRQMVSGILSYIITVLYVVSAVQIPCLWPENTGGQQYERGGGCFLLIFFSLVSAILFTVGSVVSFKVETAESTVIPKVTEMKQEQMEARYSMVSEVKSVMTEQNIGNCQTGTAQVLSGGRLAEMQNIESNQPMAVSTYIPGSVRGVLVGLSGIYAGAEIPMADGETIRFGRLSNNDLVFDNQPKVSRNHCQIRWDTAQKKFSFRDYSSNGSFANGSEECLPQNIDLWMEPGTVIAIGDNTNLFRLE